MLNSYHSSSSPLEGTTWDEVAERGGREWPRRLPMVESDRDMLGTV